MAKSRAELFAESFIRRKVRREVKERIRNYCAGLSVEDFRYAAENNLNIITALLNPGEQKSRRKKLAPVRQVLEGFSVDDFIHLFEEVSPGHAEVLHQHRAWFAKQVEIGKKDILA